MLIPDTTTTFGKTLVSIDEPASRNSQDPLLLTFSDGTTVEASAVVACDGIKSPSRSKYVLVGADSALLRPCPSEEFAYRGVYTQEEFNKITNGTISSTSGTLWCGKDAYVVMYPIEKGHFMNMVCVRRYLPISEDFKPPSSADKSWVQPVDHDTMMADFASWGAPIRALLSEIKRPERWFLFDHLPAPTFVKDRVALVGDAAHATTPHQGQGAGMAFEDSLVLSNILGSLYDSSHSPGLSAASIEAAFHAYDLVRRPRSLELVRSSREMGLIVEYGSEDIGEDLSKLKTELDTRMSWIWDIDLKGEIRKGIEIAGNYAG
ncbi:hypothetical protein KJ359_010390 [Pestalotiopsis sp. 9143b]|nr:hypothetical protein KJ359_010390 [Pestalotiopsis sp. 9143b]